MIVLAERNARRAKLEAQLRNAPAPPVAPTMRPVYRPRYAPAAVAAPVAAAVPAAAAAPLLQAAADEEDDWNECISCCEREKKALFLPCGHLRMCMPCARDWIKSRGMVCHECSRAIDEVYDLDANGGNDDVV